MSFPVDDIVLGPRSWGLLHRLDGMIWHTGEESGFTRALAVATAEWQTRNPGSYNFRIYDGGVMLNVPYLEASGGVNPGSSAWAPERFPFLARDLAKAGRCPVDGCPGPYRNPTMHHLQVSFVGRTADLEAGRAPASYVPDARRLIAWADTLPNRGPAPLVHSKHAHWQTNRSDPGDRIFVQLAPAAPEGDMTIRSIITEDWTTGTGEAGGWFLVGGERKWFTSPERVTSVAELTLADGTDARLVAYGSGEALVMPRRNLTPIPGTRVVGLRDTAALEAALNAANVRTASVKTKAAELLRKGAAANRDTATGLEAAAKNVEGL